MGFHQLEDWPISTQNLSLNLIDCPVIAMGAASGLLRGTIKALFYRYSSIGGYDNVADFLIAPDQNSSNTRHGDSGAIWHLDVTKQEKLPLLQRQLKPLAIEWGGQCFDMGGSRSAFAIATSLSNACKLLNVELVTNNETGVSGYWGRTGHYSIAELAIGQVKNKDLRMLLDANRELLSFDLDTIAQKNFSKNDAKDETRLADVPDDVWKHLPKGGKTPKKGGRDTQPMTGPEHPNHFADVDVPYANSTLRALCLAQPAKYLTPDAWQAYYAYLHKYYTTKKDTEGATNAARSDKQGLLPFRIWQIFNDMSEFATKKEFDKFVCAAGIFAHYVGDASQPLHASYLADGDRQRSIKNPTKTHKYYGEGSHSAYESDMLDVAAGAGLLFPAINKNLKDKAKLLSVSNGRDAALAAVHLMDDVAKRLPPQHILDVYEELRGWESKAQTNRLAMWKKLGDSTGNVMALGIQYLAHLWDAAWVAGGSPSPKPKTFTSKEMSALYCRSDFLPSYTLDEIGVPLGFASTAKPAKGKKPAAKEKRAKNRHAGQSRHPSVTMGGG